MWKWIKNKLQPEVTPLPEKSESVKPHQIYIDKILNNLIQSRSILNIHFQDSEDSYVSMLLDVNKSQDYIVIDEITPKEGHKQAMQGGVFTISTKEHGVSISFQARVLKHVEEKDTNYYYLPYPQDINYEQRRKAYRVPIQSESALRADLFLPNQPRLTAKVADISVTGLRLLVRYNIMDILDSVRYIDQCLLVSPLAKPTTFSLEIRQAYYDLSLKSTVLCCEFLDISADKQLYLIELVGKLQQNQVQKRFNQANP